jgi:aspartyl aminopeptidase
MPVQEKQAVATMAESYKDFLARSVCASWTVKTLIEEAQKRGFKPLPTDGRALKPGEKYYLDNDGTAVALMVIGKGNPVQTGFNLIGAHVDSPQLELKPNPVTESQGIVQFKTKTRGGGTWMTWFNRPLGIAGRVFEPVLDGQGRPELNPDTRLPKEKVTFVRVDTPSLVIPLEPIHFNRELNRGRDIKPEDDLSPLAAISKEAEGQIQETVSANAVAILKKQGIDLTRAHRAELFLFPSSPPVDTGVDGSMILAQGHDDRAMCYAAMEGLFQAAAGKVTPEKTGIAFFFANEETGSMDRGGATSRWPETVASLVVRGQTPPSQLDNLTQAREEALSKSFIFSADVAHGWFPSQAKYHDGQNAVYMGQGPVFKADSGGHYATTPKGMAIAEDLFKRAGVPFQVMSTNQNVSCGTTIGPMIAANTNALTVDIGIPILSMHSANEVAAKVDLYLATKAFASFYRND